MNRLTTNPCTNLVNRAEASPLWWSCSSAGSDSESPPLSEPSPGGGKHTRNEKTVVYWDKRTVTGMSNM